MSSVTTKNKYNHVHVHRIREKVKNQGHLIAHVTIVFGKLLNDVTEFLPNLGPMCVVCSCAAGPGEGSRFLPAVAVNTTMHEIDIWRHSTTEY